MRMSRSIVAFALAVVSVVALALPSVEAVRAEAQRGHWAQAETMMQEVVSARPGSARAHYVYAEILAHNRRFEQAAAEAARARRIDPSIAFTDPAEFAAFEKALERQSSAARASTTAPAPATRVSPVAAAPEASAAVPTWAWVLGLAAVAAIVFVVVSRRRQATIAPPVAGSAYSAAPSGPFAASGSGWGQPGPTRGPGLMGVGLAAAGGVAAGMLAERLLHGSHDAPTAAPAGSQPAGGLVPGMFDDDSSGSPAASDLEQRAIDYGRGDGWGDDDAGGIDAGW